MEQPPTQRPLLGVGVCVDLQFSLGASHELVFAG